MYMKANLSFQSKRFAGFLFFGLFIFLLFLSLFLALCNVWIWQESLAEANLVGKADIFIFRDLIWANVEKCLLSQGFLSQHFYSCAPPEGFTRCEANTPWHIDSWQGFVVQGDTKWQKCHLGASPSHSWWTSQRGFLICPWLRCNFDLLESKFHKFLSTYAKSCQKQIHQDGSSLAEAHVEMLMWSDKRQGIPAQGDPDVHVL